jgi:hypothetical protein
MAEAISIGSAEAYVLNEAMLHVRKTHVQQAILTLPDRA